MPGPPAAAPAEIVLDDGDLRFAIASHLLDDNGFPYLDWSAAEAWVQALPEPQQTRAWAACERGWLEHLRHTLGERYRIDEDDGATLLSALDTAPARAALRYVNTTSQRVKRVLDGIAHVPEWGQDILLVFGDEEAYYRYLAHYYPAAGEYALSGGMYVNHGCAHFATIEADLHAIEPVIAHEMAHGCLAHLPLPAWLNEGIAVNVEQRLAPRGRGPLSPQQMQEKHRSFWDAARLQEFWSGASFLRPDDGCMLSYDLARIMVEQMSKDWPAFREFVVGADAGDAGLAAAREHLGIELGGYVCALLESAHEGANWAPSPSAWSAAPERGGF